ncbi:MAG TPA: hypothetical protein EYO58_10900 [Flavobacteriales bacterium]|nr:hypothetical protein [Flavobacteriales bacterium]
MATKKKVKETLFKAGIARLIDWLWNKRWDVEFDYMTHDEMDPMTKCVTINARQGIEKQLYSLLHECGHILIQSNEAVYNKKFPASAKRNCFLSHRQLEKSKKYKVDVIAEEIEAWDRGKSLATRLGIYVDENKFNEFKVACVFTYVEWATEKHERTKAF